MTERLSTPDRRFERLGIVVIGRNEGERLVRCLRSVHRRGVVVYVDSGSTDGSLAAARELADHLVELDMSLPFTAARARNAGATKLGEVAPSIEYIQFVDGDCEMDAAWLLAAQQSLGADAGLGAVCGHLKERHPRASVYNRIGDVEWRRPAGEVEHCGGIFMIRRKDFECAGRFDPSIAAGEEPELCCRLRASGLRMVRLDIFMATHDLNMMRLTQWWRRSVRGGYGALLLTLFGPAASRKVFRRQILSAIGWAVGFPAMVCVAGLAALRAGSGRLAVLSLAVGLAILSIQVLRIAAKGRRAELDPKSAIAYGALTMAWKFAATVGFARCLIDRMGGLLRSSQANRVREFHKAP